MVESDEHRLRFERFDFAARTFAFVLEDQPIEVCSERVYRIKVCWDKDAGECRMWLDDQPLSCAGSYALPLVRPPRRGIDTITLHPGGASARLTSLQKRQGQTARQVVPLVTCWGRFRVYDSPT